MNETLVVSHSRCFIQRTRVTFFDRNVEVYLRVLDRIPFCFNRVSDWPCSVSSTRPCGEYFPFSTEFFLDGVDHADRQTDEKRRRKIAEGIRECGEATLAMSAKGTRLDAIRRRVSFTVSDSRHRLLLSYSSSCSAMGCSIHVDAPPSNMESMSVL